MYSILGKESDASRVKLSEGIFEKLNFSFFMSYKQKDFVSELLSCDGDAIAERQKLFSAIDKSSALFEAFEALAKGAEISRNTEKNFVSAQRSFQTSACFMLSAS